MKIVIKNNNSFKVIFFSLIVSILAIWFIPNLNFLKPILFSLAGLILVLFGVNMLMHFMGGGGVGYIDRYLVSTDFRKKKDSSWLNHINAFLYGIAYVVGGIAVIIFSIKGFMR